MIIFMMIYTEADGNKVAQESLTFKIYDNERILINLSWDN